MGCQTRLSLPPAADLDSLIQSFASTSDLDDPPAILPINSSLNGSQIRRKLFSEDEDLLDETSFGPIDLPRRSSTFDVRDETTIHSINSFSLARSTIIQSKSTSSS